MDLLYSFFGKDERDIICERSVVVMGMDLNSRDVGVCLVWISHTNVVFPGIHTPVTKVQIE